MTKRYLFTQSITKHFVIKVSWLFAIAMMAGPAFGQLNISVSTGQYYVVNDMLLGTAPPGYPQFLSPKPPCGKCENQNTGDPCTDLDTLFCPPGNISCEGQWRTGLPPNLKEDIAALKFRCMYYPDGTTYRYYHYIPGGNGYCIKSDEADVLNSWSLNNGNNDPNPRIRYCSETAYNWANIFEQNLQLFKNDSSPAKSTHIVISANVFFGSYSDLRRMFEYCAANGVTVDAVVFGTELQGEQDRGPAYVTPHGDTIPFPSGQSYFNAVQGLFIDSLKSDPLYSSLPLFFSAAIQHGSQGGCEDRTYECDDSLGSKTLWNSQVHNAIVGYNKTHYPHLKFAGAVNWWWFPISNTSPNPSPTIAINDMNEFFDSSLSITGHAQCYKYPMGNVGGPTTGFDELLLNQWGIKKYKMICENHDYSNTFLNQVFLLKRIFNMFDNNYNMLYNPSKANGITYKGAFFYRMGDGNPYDPLDLEPDSASIFWLTENTSNYAFRQINDASGHKVKRADITGVTPQNLEAYFLFNCSEQKLFIINYSGIPYSIARLAIDSDSFADTAKFDYEETSVTDASTHGALATLSEINESVPWAQVKLKDVIIPANSILIIPVPFIHPPGTTEVCNGIDDDCDSQIDEDVQSVFYLDSDSDDYGNANLSTVVNGCSAPIGYVSDTTDCNDANAAIHPNAIEICNGIDDNCNGSIDEGVKTTFYADADNDTYGNLNVTTQACTKPSGYVSDHTDCNDANAAIHPGATETCNGIDDNCDGSIDEGVKITFYADADNDTYGNLNVTTQACTKPSGYVSNSTDCNDANAAVHPGATETCNGIDDNCDGSIDEGVKITFYADADNDTYGNLNVTTQACTKPSGYVSDHTDCNDANAAIHPGATETCNGIDDNCDGSIDEGVKITFYADADNDTYGNLSVTTQACTKPSGYVSNSTDCNDANAAVHPGATETCNGIDDNCDGSIDEGVKTTFYADADNDTYGNLNVTTQACTKPNGYVSDHTDCNDANAAIHPGATETCNGIDDNCDGSIDEGVKTTFYADADNDTYGNLNVTTQACTKPSGYVSDHTDCNDANAAIHPGATETCNGIDDNCNGSIDEGVKTTFYADADNDTYGNLNVTTQACTKPSGYVSNSTDCNDANAAVHPGATETCNGIDDNCDGSIDEGVKTTFYADADNDTYGNLNVTTQACTKPNGYVSDHTDCNDANAAIHPGAADICNSIDDNCNQIVDENAIQATISPSGTINICSGGSSATLTANSGSGISYQWLKNSKNISGATTQTYSTKTAAGYQVKETNTFSCNSTSPTTTLNVITTPPATITALGNLNICQTGSVTLQANAGTGFTYQWQKGNSDISGATKQSYIATKAATYKVIVTSGGCSQTSKGTTVTKSCKESSGSELQDAFKVYPNPTGGKFTVELNLHSKENETGIIEMMNSMGEIIYTEKFLITNDQFTDGLFRIKKEISLGPSLPPEIYIVRAITNVGVYSAQLIYQK